MNTLSSIEFGRSTTTSPEVLSTISEHGACIVHDFLAPEVITRAARDLSSPTVNYVTDAGTPNAKVERHHALAYFTYHRPNGSPTLPGIPSAPTGVNAAAHAIDNYLEDGTQHSWRPNEIAGIRYEFGDHIGPHRDYSSAVGFVAVVTVAGRQNFIVESDDGETYEIPLRPGSLAVMRGYGHPSGKLRPRHWAAPAQEKRLAVSLRQMRLGWD